MIDLHSYKVFFFDSCMFYQAFLGSCWMKGLQTTVKVSVNASFFIGEKERLEQLHRCVDTEQLACTRTRTYE